MGIIIRRNAKYTATPITEANIESVEDDLDEDYSIEDGGWVVANVDAPDESYFLSKEAYRKDFEKV
jgi:hypothetical protein